MKETWTKHVGKGFRPGESGTDIIYGSQMGIAYTDLILEIGEEGQIDSKKETGRTVREIWDYETVKPCNLLGPTAGYWLKKILATSIEWKAFRGTLHAWHREKESNFERRKVYLQEVLYTWEEVRVAFHVWHVKNLIAFIAWQALKKMKHSGPAEDMNFEVCMLHYYN